MAGRIPREFLLFCLAGSIGYIVDVGVVFALKEMLGPYIARIPAFFAAATVTWALNRRYTFAVVVKKSIWQQYVHYLSLMMVGGCLNYMVYLLCMYILYGWLYNVFVAVALGSLAGVVVNYFNSKQYVFKT